MQVTKYHLNNYSIDGNTQALYKDCIQKKAKQVRWNGVRELEQRERHLILKEMCRGPGADPRMVRIGTGPPFDR